MSIGKVTCYQQWIETVHNVPTVAVLNGKHPLHYTIHRSDSIQGTDYIATPIQGFLG